MSVKLLKDGPQKFVLNKRVFNRLLPDGTNEKIEGRIIKRRTFVNTGKDYVDVKKKKALEAVTGSPRKAEGGEGKKEHNPHPG